MNPFLRIFAKPSLNRSQDTPCSGLHYVLGEDFPCRMRTKYVKALRVNELRNQATSRVLVADDESDLVELVTLNLEKHGYQTLKAFDGREGLTLARAERPDLAIVDVMMPEIDGVELVRRIKADPQLEAMPIIMLTAKTAEQDELAALSIGADDFVTKPFSMRVLVARVQSLLRRSQERTRELPTGLRLGEIHVDLDRHEVTVDGQTVQLTLTEYRILVALLVAEGRVLSRATLIGKAIGVGVAVTKRTIDVHVTSLRRKLGEQARLVETVRGVGYRAGEDSSEEEPSP